MFAIEYAWMVMWFTALVAVLYSLMGLAGHQLLYVRIIETVIGAAFGVAASALILPTHSRGRIAGAIRAAAEPLTRRALPVARETVQLVHFATTLVFYTRQLSAPELLASLGPDAATAREAMQRLAGDLRKLAAASRVEAPFELSAAQPIARRLPPTASLLAHWLRRLEETVVDVANLLRPRAR